MDAHTKNFERKHERKKYFQVKDVMPAQNFPHTEFRIY